MADRLVLVNGLPGAGKTTLANHLASALDVLKEAMAAALPGIPATAFGAVASGSMWDLAAATPGRGGRAARCRRHDRRQDRPAGRRRGPR